MAFAQTIQQNFAVFTENYFIDFRGQIRASQKESAEKNTDSKRKTVQTLHSSKTNKYVQSNKTSFPS